MKRIALLTGLVLVFAAGTASAQTSVRLSIGFEAPRPYVSGIVVIGRSHMRPVYRPYHYRHRRHGRMVVVTPPVIREPRRVIVVPRGPARHGERDRR
jgi:hypothetical protein